MRAALKELAGETFDVVIVGAGIHGACTAWVAARLGLKTALIDADDFGAATSANSLKVIHGGLRYLQHGNLARMRESIRARRRFLRLAPRCVKPQAFAIPTAGRGVRSRAALKAALALNDAISFDRNRDLGPQQQLPRGRVVSAQEARAIWPQLPHDAYDGAAVWYDALAHDTERLTLAFALAARDAGATPANYVRARRVLVENGAAAGVEACDALGGDPFAIRARAVVNAAGPWWEQWSGARAARHPLVGAWNLIARAQWFGPYGVGLEGAHAYRDAEALVQRGRRNLFFVPWRGGTMIGTVYERYAGEPSAYQPSRAAIESFVEEINDVLPGAPLTMDQISLLHVGVQPAPSAGLSAEPDKQSSVGEGPVRGLFSIKGVKYTTGLTVGERAARMVARALGRRDRVGPDAPLADGAPEGDLATRVRHAVREEYAVRLVDVLRRRTDLGTFEPPPAETQREIAALMAKECGWSPAQQAAELEHAASVFRRLTP